MTAPRISRRHRCRNCLALVPVADLRETLPAMLSGRLVPAWQCRARGKCKRQLEARAAMDSRARVRRVSGVIASRQMARRR